MLDDVWCSDAAAVCLFRSTVRTISVVRECEKNSEKIIIINNIIILYSRIYIYIA